MAEATRVALVTGGAKRVGRTIVQRLAAAGFDVAFTWHTSQSEANGLAESLRGDGHNVLAIRADLSDPEPATQSIYHEVRQRFGRLDVLVNNASIYTPQALADTDVGLMRTLDAVHMHAPLLLCQRFDLMLRVNRGHVINMLDLLAEKPWPRYMAYCASKAGLWNLTLSLARELAPEVTVNGIAPGVVEWPEDMPDEERAKYLERVPLRRAGSAEDVANLVEFLVTRGSYITGQVIRLDGGRSIR